MKDIFRCRSLSVHRFRLDGAGSLVWFADSNTKFVWTIRPPNCKYERQMACERQFSMNAFILPMTSDRSFPKLNENAISRMHIITKHDNRSANLTTTGRITFSKSKARPSQ